MELILANCTDYRIVGVLDANAAKEEFCKKPVIPLEQLGRYEVDSIIIIARKSSAMIIRNRIIHICRRFHITLYDLHGNDPGAFIKNCSVDEIRKHSGSAANLAVINLFSEAYSVWTDCKNARQFGYTFAAPLITAFCISLFKYMKEKRYGNVCLLSRDGYLFKKCLEILKSRFGCDSEFLYLLTSRRALSDRDNQQNYLRYIREVQSDEKEILIVDSFFLYGFGI